jgi:Polysaccharide deacetylase
MIPLLITMDLEVAYDHDIDEQQDILAKIQEDLLKLQLPITVFTTSEAARIFRDGLKSLKDCGNEIGCHGWNHDTSENYRMMTSDYISRNITSSTSFIEDIVKYRPVSFRGPGMSTSTETQRILLENGYTSDYSVCSQRIDFFNSIGWNAKWLSSPRLPYHPSEKSPYTRGNLPIWVIPLSCIGLPFISGILYLFGTEFMKFFARMLIRESMTTGKPIVYLFHSYEFCSYTRHRKETEVQKRAGKKTLHRLYAQDIRKRYNDNLDLLKYMSSIDSICPFTAKSYEQYLVNF